MASVKEVDLHLEAFIRNTSGLSNENMVQLSLKRMRDALDNAIERGYTKSVSSTVTAKELYVNVYIPNYASMKKMV